ncbi:hypothetical protein [Blastopirellula marina]|uniref:Uncharacterized protein n=1 Tax=Blastopirellula marina DSM 3645 TaxID=314230 RepID=A3ZX79_9BACT|nr:hypothetical protein [Blastopirellula marina]EAQ78960.1 hypothetical protein DSM3645_27808 [Blastopirellula marina DSM 3645]
MSRRNRQLDCSKRNDARPSIVPAGTPNWITPELIEATIRTWQPYYKEVLTPEEAVTMILGVSRLYQVLSSSKPP